MAKAYTLGPRTVRALKAKLNEKPDLSGVYRRKAGGGGDGDNGKWFRIDDADQDGTNQRWVYSLVEVEKTSAGYGGWTDKSGGISTAYGYNGAENPNNTTGSSNGIGIDLTALTGTFALKQVNQLGSPIVKAWPVTVGEITEWWFHHVNHVDGEC